MIKKYILGIITTLITITGFSYGGAIPDMITITPGEYYDANENVDAFTLNNDLSFSNPIIYRSNTVKYAFYRDTNKFLNFYVENQYGKSNYIITGYNLVQGGITGQTTQLEMINYVNRNINNIENIKIYFGYTCQSNYNYGTTFTINFNNGDYIFFAGGLCQGNKLYVNPGGGPLNKGTEIILDSIETYESPFNGKRQGNTTTTINTPCPTIGQLMYNMGSQYNTGLCYNNTTYFNGSTFEQVEKQDIFTIFNNDYQNYINRISIYRNNCTNANTTLACQNAYSGEYKKYSIISNAINSNVDEKKLRNYCNYGLNYDPNTTICVASGGGIKEEYTNEEIVTDLINNSIIVTPGINETGNTNNVLNALNECENGNRECYINNRNFIESLGNIYGKITGLFKERNGVNGIIPNYILRITFLTILFTVIFKK